MILLAACGGGGGGGSAASVTAAPETVVPTDPSITPSSDPGTTTPPPTDPGTTPPTVVAPLHVGMVGCSVTDNAVDGYHLLGGNVLWPTVSGYGGGTISAWALDISTLSPYWHAFDAALAANPATDAIWVQLCTNTSGASQDTFENAQVVINEIHSRAPNVRIFVSAQHSYSDVVCGIAGADGPAQMQAIADQLVAAQFAEAGPILGPLSLVQTSDSCHANVDGALVLGAQLEAFFK